MRERKFKKCRTATFIVFALLYMAVAGESDNHQVTVAVNAINEISISGGSVDLTINTAMAGYNPNSVMDIDDPCILYWTSNESSKKITVATSLANPKFSLYLNSHNTKVENTWALFCSAQLLRIT